MRNAHTDETITMEIIQELKITIHIETDKSIRHKTFDNLKDATEYLNKVLCEIK